MSVSLQTFSLSWILTGTGPGYKKNTLGNTTRGTRERDFHSILIKRRHAHLVKSLVMKVLIVFQSRVANCFCKMLESKYFRFLLAMPSASVALNAAL